VRSKLIQTTGLYFYPDYRSQPMVYWELSANNIKDQGQHLIHIYRSKVDNIKEFEANDKSEFEHRGQYRSTDNIDIVTECKYLTVTSVGIRSVT